MSKEDILKQIEQQQRLLLNYEELATDAMDDPAYVARGNGFCDTKYSDDFLSSQVSAIRARIAELQCLLQNA